MGQAKTSSFAASARQAGHPAGAASSALSSAACWGSTTSPPLARGCDRRNDVSPDSRHEYSPAIWGASHASSHASSQASCEVVSCTRSLAVAAGAAAAGTRAAPGGSPGLSGAPIGAVKGDGRSGPAMMHVGPAKGQTQRPGSMARRVRSMLKRTRIEGGTRPWGCPKHTHRRVGGAGRPAATQRARRATQPGGAAPCLLNHISSYYREGVTRQPKKGGHKEEGGKSRCRGGAYGTRARACVLTQSPTSRRRSPARGAAQTWWAAAAWRAQSRCHGAGWRTGRAG